MTSQRNKFKDAREKGLRLAREVNIKMKNDIKKESQQGLNTEILKNAILELKAKINRVTLDLEKKEFKTNLLIINKKNLYEQKLHKLEEELKNVN